VHRVGVGAEALHEGATETSRASWRTARVEASQ
jgi:hypothetical protein